MFLGPKGVFYLTFAPLHTPLHLSPRLRDLGELFLEFWTGFNPKKEVRPFVLQGFFKGEHLPFYSPNMHWFSTYFVYCFGSCV